MTKLEIAALVREAFDIGIVQVPEEIESLALFLDAYRPINILEIGVWKGGSFHVWSKLSTGLKIAVDLPGGPFGGAMLSSTDLVRRNIALECSGLILGDSHSETVLEHVKAILKDEKLDFLFVDGDHTYDGVTQDFLMYKGLVSPYGWIGFHDINDSEWHRSLNVGVWKLWAELKGRKIEFNAHENWAGIGLIQGGELDGKIFHEGQLWKLTGGNEK